MLEALKLSNINVNMKNYSELKEELLLKVIQTTEKLETDGDDSYYLLKELNLIFEKYNKLLQSNENELFFLRKLVDQKDEEIDMFSTMLSESDDERNLPLNVKATFGKLSNADVTIDFYVNIEIYQDLCDEYGELLPENKEYVERKIINQAENVFKFENYNKLNVYEYNLISYEITSHENECMEYGITDKIYDL
jgi:hypothetical protein